MTNLIFYSKIGISEEEHDLFVKQHEQINVLQSSAWAKIKNQWQNERIGIFKGEKQVASLSLLIKPLPFGRSIIYIPRGPVMDYLDRDLVAFTMKTLKDYGKTKKALFIKYDPAVLLKQYALGQEGEENPLALAAIKNLQEVGAHWTGLTMEIADSIQPRFQANIYTQEKLEMQFPKHTRRLMKDARQRGVETYRASQSELQKFAKIVSLTEKRKNISLRNEAYFQKLMTTYGDKAYLHLAKVNIPQKLDQYRQQLNLINQDIISTQAHQKKRLKKLEDQKTSLERYITEFEGFTAQYPEEVVVAGILSISYGNVMEMLYAGMNDDFKKFYPQYLLYPKVFQDAYQDGIVWANMGGVEGSLDDGLTKFKANFSPTIEEFIGEFNLPVSPLYHIANVMYKIRKQLRNKH
ncbi:putative antimicrobial resistance factor [Streptococcus canis]|uniref:UDP-N-acetylmuramoylpentapeptide-lysine N(6)-alanyltransferase / UDP-N-acetylmuramoylpentapeptide-lysine n=1 Tax=Streptococcus canis FSL Z3-227 TaxID=482234 RepID=A0AAV3FUD2_STRCB|nr:lipid II:glycine glycyltransferase FemX [Streptococcus canis]EIQ81992.1 UDP-N-acetylmuramoylpentapeptide-lysine N(6)-alanyltransferase / UDP-N-acetylmuramoylpentapeptide-lysine [Streptococcus canis FSL Z3-227]MDV5988031.1 aminoacyltransferase [Streptococcus canis]MDV5993074.1 aminoacyltransferase [Streptococcus canis]MDV6001219.1 aminoacyltransferase [Streptococcus canis]MDV6022385.1 aminoacyltransferase [Streptococcus canis]